MITGLARKSHKPLTAQEEKQLLQENRIEYVDADGNQCVGINEYARNILSQRNMRYVLAMARRFKERIDIDEAYAAGLEGLVKALNKFNPDLGFRFCTYASQWINQYIQYRVHENHVVHVPVNKVLEQRKGQEKKGAAHAVQGLKQSVGFDHPVGKVGESRTLNELIADNSDVSGEVLLEREERSKMLYAMLAKLSEKEVQVIKYYYGIDCEQLSIKEISETMHLHEIRVQQIRTKALNTLKLNNKKTQAC